mgnify:CR=1 FL=1
MEEKVRNITQADIDRINELYKKSQSEAGLTDAEREEQTQLRKDYIAAIRRNLRGTLENIDLVDERGNVTSVKDLGASKK